MNSAIRKFAFVLVAIALTTAGGARAVAITIEEAKSKCIATVGPTVPACARWQTMQKRGNPDTKDIQECQAQVRKCVTNLVMPGSGGFRPSVLDTAKPDAAQSTKNSARTNAAPPRTIADITAILDQEKPDPGRLAKLRAVADAVAPSNADPVSLAHFFASRSTVRSELGRFREALDDGERAVELAKGKVGVTVLSNFRISVARQYSFVGEPQKAAAECLKIIEETDRAGERSFNFPTYGQLINIEITLGNYDRAQSYVRRVEDLWKQAGSFLGYQYHHSSWESNIENGKGRLYEARGEFEAAVKSYERAEALRRRSIDELRGSALMTPRAVHEQMADAYLLNAAVAKSKLGRIAEAESDARRALLNRLQATGKYHPQTVQYIAALGSLLIEQGRYAEAKKLINGTIEIYRELGIAEDSQTVVTALNNLATVKALEGQWAEAAASFAAVEAGTKDWEPLRRETVLTTLARIVTLYKTGQIEAGLDSTRRLLAFRTARLGEQHADTALARGLYGIGLAYAKREADALKEFETAIPLLTSNPFDTDNDDVLNAAARTRYTQEVVENYIALLGRLNPSTTVAGETFRLADTIRGHAVQKALTASGARMSANDPKLAGVVRQEQDLRQQIGTQLGQLNNLLALPASQRDEAGVAELRKQIDKMRAEHTKLRTDIDRRFPDYAELIDPKPPTLQQVREILRPGEALLSFYFGREASFVWAISQDGKAAFATLREGAADIDTKIAKLRESLEPQVAMVSDIPPFDLALSHELYKTLVEPVKAGWKDANSLIVVTNGALGLLPLGVLTVAPHEMSQNGAIFAGYRDAPWLSRTHAVTMVPSASALRTLRRLPAGSAKRDALIAFGDPIFNKTQANERGETTIQVADAAQTRGLPLARRAAPQTEGMDSAVLEQLPRLPDTADELKSIALALEADPSKVLHLGKDANEQTVKKTDLSHFKIIVFATHGLVPGEIDGLTQPALALSAPSVTGVEGDGLLTMEEILALKLDADWVVLSACNTGAGAGAGAEAASGLGRAFFYAGTRAILVTNWSVHSQSARELVSDLFRRQAADPKITRGEALRAAMMALLDGPGFVDDKGKTLFTYAHPLFWAPYTIIGDGGGTSGK